MPIVLKQERKSANRIVKSLLKVEACVFVLNVRDDVNAGLTVRLKSIILKTSSSHYKIRADNSSNESVIKKKLTRESYAQQPIKSIIISSISKLKGLNSYH